MTLDEGQALLGPIEAVLRRLRQASRPADAALLEYVQRLLCGLGGGAPADLADASAAAHTAATPWHGQAITNKEMRVLELLAEGDSNRAMAAKLFVAESTVRTHLRSISIKLAARNRTQAVSIARRHGLLR